MLHRKLAYTNELEKCRKKLKQTFMKPTEVKLKWKWNFLLAAIIKYKKKEKLYCGCFRNGNYIYANSIAFSL